jgi:CHAD domain-containing protein
MNRPELDRLRQPAPQGARRTVLDLLDGAAAARTRLDDPADPEALHDFRVAVRRLRSALRTYAGNLGAAASPRSRRRWRAVAGGTGAGRDAEAQGDWLDRALPTLAPAARPAARALSARLRERRAREAAAVAESARRFERLAVRLRDDLSSYTVRLDETAAPILFGEVAAARVRDLAGELAAALAKIGGAADESGAHAARIAGKRLRYALEVAAPGARRELGRLRELQDLLGELHDVHGLIRRATRRARRQAEDRARHLAAAVLEHGTGSDAFHRAARRGSWPSWWPLLDALRARQDALFQRLSGEWLAGGEETIGGALGGLLGVAATELPTSPIPRAGEKAGVRGGRKAELGRKPPHP